jgi:hypothetical protein
MLCKVDEYGREDKRKREWEDRRGERERERERERAAAAAAALSSYMVPSGHFRSCQYEKYSERSPYLDI